MTVEPPDVSGIITEDDTPVDNIFSEKQQRLLVEPLNSSWRPGMPFVAAANVGIFNAINQPPIVPDMFLSLDVRVAEDIWLKKNRSYFLWEFGKPPEVVIEVVSNTKGGESDRKFRKYAHIGVLYYVVFDPQHLIQKKDLRVFELHVGKYIPKVDSWLPSVELGVTLWEGVFESMPANWLRWCDKEGNVIPSGLESSDQANVRADQAEQEVDRVKQEAGQANLRAEQAKQEADQANLRAEKMAELLRAKGID
ncbi:MAG: Uma2 family endonuclease, partial [Proteobacteria bacterium]|nr:Uma2 family endonuclease [Pseudomonadota bacterium]